MKWNGQFEHSEVAVACMHQSRTWPHFPDHFVNFPHQGAAWVSASVFAPRPRKRRTAHLSQNNARSNYITLSGKGAAGPASNLFALPPSLPLPNIFHEAFSNLWPKSAKSEPRSQTPGKRRRQKTRGRRQSAKVASFHFNTFLPPLFMFELGQHGRRIQHSF